MKIEYYPIRGRGENGSKFQLARIKDETGNLHKGAFDQERHFGSEDELKQHLAEILSVQADTLTVSKMNL